METESFIRHIELMAVHIREHAIEPFVALVNADPEKAIAELPRYLNQALDAGGGFFSGRMAGGPHEGVTSPFINALGLVYPALNQPQRERALVRCLGVLDRLSYPLAQDNVALIQEPLLVGDIVANRWLYFSGYREYKEKIKQCQSWEEFEEAYFEEGYFSGKSFFWLTLTTALFDCCPEKYRVLWEARFPEIADRTKSAIATLIHSESMVEEARRPTTYAASIESRINRFAVSWQEEIRRKLVEGSWVLLPDFYNQLAWLRERSQKEGRE